VLLNIEIVLKM